MKRQSIKTVSFRSNFVYFVASTIHTNDSISAIFRLKDMHAESYLISSALKLVISQRLIRKLCPYCKEEYEEDSVLLEGVKRVFKPVGCIHCNGGFKDRIGVFEVLLIDSNIKNLINRNANYNEILNYARTNGFTTLKENLIKKVEDGITSIEEIIRII